MLGIIYVKGPNLEILNYNQVIVTSLTLFHILFSYFFIYAGIKSIVKKEKFAFVYFVIDYLFYLLIQYVEVYKAIDFSSIATDIGFSISQSFTYLNIFVLIDLFITYCVCYFTNKKKDF